MAAMNAKQEYFSYKDYFGSAEVSHEDHCLIGQLLHIDDLVMYEGTTYDELEQAFQKSVDDYLEFCEQVGKKPEKTYSGSFNVRIGPALHRAAAHAAQRAGVSLNDYVRQAVVHGPMETSALYLGTAPHFSSFRFHADTVPNGMYRGGGRYLEAMPSPNQPQTYRLHLVKNDSQSKVA